MCTVGAILLLELRFRNGQLTYVKVIHVLITPTYGNGRYTGDLLHVVLCIGCSLPVADHVERLSYAERLEVSVGKAKPAQSCTCVPANSTVRYITLSKPSNTNRNARLAFLLSLANLS